MLQLTRKADYGLRLMLEVGGSPSGTTTTAEAAQRQQIPYEFLRKVAHTLVSNGLLVSERGVHGGLALARPAETISVLDIVRAFESPALNLCCTDPPRCDRRDMCAVYPVWVEAQSEVERVLGGCRLSSLIDRQAMLDRRGAGSQATRRATLTGPGENA
jgi:Rrf2 family protein